MIIPKTHLYRILNAFEREDMPALFQPAIDRGYALFGRLGDSPVPRSQEAQLRRDMGEAITAIFITPSASSTFPDGRSAFAADNITAISPYAQKLNRRIIQVAVQITTRHKRYMEQRLPEDVQRWLTTSPKAAELGPRGQPPIVRSNPLANYDPAHTWIDPNGYQLSARIWNTSVAARQAVDRLLADGIRQGRSAIDIAKDLERFLRPGQRLRRTKKPYGRDANYPALRLARTEITRAHAQASVAAAIANPLVSGMDWVLSARHPRYDICDQLASIGMSGQRLREPYPVASCPQPVSDSHPNCLCHLRPSVTEDESTVIEDLRAAMRVGERPYINPLVSMRFIEALVGASLIGLALEWLNEVFA